MLSVNRFGVSWKKKLSVVSQVSIADLAKMELIQQGINHAPNNISSVDIYGHLAMHCQGF